MPNLLAHIILAVVVWAGSSIWSPGHSSDGAERQAPFTLSVMRGADLSLRLSRAHILAGRAVNIL